MELSESSKSVPLKLSKDEQKVNNVNKGKYIPPFKRGCAIKAEAMDPVKNLEVKSSINVMKDESGKWIPSSKHELRKNSNLRDQFWKSSRSDSRNRNDSSSSNWRNRSQSRSTCSDELSNSRNQSPSGSVSSLTSNDSNSLWDSKYSDQLPTSLTSSTTSFSKYSRSRTKGGDLLSKDSLSTLKSKKSKCSPESSFRNQIRHDSNSQLSNWRNHPPPSLSATTSLSEDHLDENAYSRNNQLLRFSRRDSLSRRHLNRNKLHMKKQYYFTLDENQRDNVIIKLNELTEKLPSEILLILSDERNGLIEFIQQPYLGMNIINVLLSIFKQALISEMHSEIQFQLMVSLLGSQFFEKHVPIFVSSFLTAKNDSFSACFNILISLFEVFLHRMPTITTETLNPCILLCINVMETLVQKNVEIDSEVESKIYSIQNKMEIIMEEIKETRKKQQQEKLHEKIIQPSKNFRDLAIIPTVDEINTNCKPFLRKNIVEGKYADVEHYLDVQFRLLREDFVAPLRLGICVYLKDHSQNKNHYKFQDVPVYNNVIFSKSVCKQEKIIYEFQFDINPFKRYKWETSQRLIFGSLLCLSADNFNTCLFASVADRNIKQLKKGIIEVVLEYEFGDIFLTKADAKKMYTMVESPAYFEAYRHILKSLKRFNMDNLPLQDYIVYLNNEHVPPAYVLENKECDLSLMMKSNLLHELEHSATFYLNSLDRRIAGGIGKEQNQEKSVITTDISTWPTAESLNLDESQRKAMQLALSSSVAVIQGPPGTGKTFIGQKIVQTLLQNHPDIKPILIVCFTNHALDQFLEGILSYTGNLVRVGGRCESRTLQDYNLKEIAKNDVREFLQQKDDLYEDLRCQQRILGKYKGDLMSVTTFILKDTSLEMLPEPDRSLVSELNKSYKKEFKFSFIPKVNRPCNILSAWLGLTIDNLISDYEMEEFYHHNVKQSFLKIERDPKIQFKGGKLDLVETNDDLIDIANEATTGLKNRMLDMDLSLSKKTEDNYLVIGCSKHWEINVNKLDDPYYMYGLEKKPSKKNKTMKWVKRNDGSLKKKFSKLKSIAQRELSLDDCMEDSMVTEELNIWNLNVKDRWRLYRRWLKLFQIKRKEQIENLRCKYADIGKELKNVRNQQYFTVLSKAKIIGMTTTGAARCQSILYEIGCKIVIIEEAAEVLESHIISSLNPKTEHLILIGDHLQLRPKPNVYDLAKRYNLEISLFERLIKNRLPYATLELQHRMRPEISRLIRTHIYPDLRDHESVLSYPAIRGMKSNVFFVTHSEKEEDLGENKSHANIFEAQFVVALCRYLIQQKYKPNQITILTLYTGQVYEIQQLMPRRVFEGVRIVAVDNYQGEENDIILLSLVRSNDEGKIGFVKIENRINVALSRARQGLYAIGNIEFLANNSDLWKRLIADLQKNKLIGTSLNTKCQNHPEMESIISSGRQFQQFVPEGGCLVSCNYPLPCGHICNRVCHIDAHGDCIQPCRKKCPRDHPCRSQCFIKCEPCQVLITETLPCTHKGKLPCSMEPAEFKCPIIMERNLECGHSVDLPCHLKPEDYECKELVERILPHCEHKIISPCSENINNIECNEDCIFRLNCGHKCELKCHPHKDIEHLEIRCLKQCEKIICKIHSEKCTNECWDRCSFCKIHVEKTLICGHKVNTYCGEKGICTMPCEKFLSCGHQCKAKCSQCCDKTCKELVEKTLNCGHKVNTYCGEKDICTMPCEKFLSCGHQCKAKCSESCEKTCKELVEKLASCGHLIQVECYLLNKDFLPEIEYFENPFSCKNRCDRKLSCGHVCQKLCYEKCTEKCKEVVKVMGSCKHEVDIYCCNSSLHPDIISLSCQEQCSQILSCKHQCQGTCGDCRQGRLHVPCKRKCDRINICGHICENLCSEVCSPCGKTCSVQCRHNESVCGLPNRKCYEQCEWRCPHFSCSRYCNENCNRPPCNEPCLKTLSCGHGCISLCGEICPILCRYCNTKDLSLDNFEKSTDIRFIQLEDCGHCIEVKTLDEWMKRESDEIHMKSCPVCNTTIWHSYRYGNIILECLEKVQTVNKHISKISCRTKCIMNRLQFELVNMPLINEYFKTYYENISEHLSEENILNYNECVLIENQFHLLAAMAEMVDSYHLLKRRKAKHYLKLNINFLSRRLLLHNQEKSNQLFVSEEELNKINTELLRIYFFVLWLELDTILFMNSECEDESSENSASEHESSENSASEHESSENSDSEYYFSSDRLDSKNISSKVTNMSEISKIALTLESGKVLTEEDETNLSMIFKHFRAIKKLRFPEFKKIVLIEPLKYSKGCWYKNSDELIYVSQEKRPITK